MTQRITLADNIPEWLDEKRVSILLVLSGVILMVLSVFLWIHVEDWLFRRNAILYNLPIALYCMFWCNELSRNRHTIPLSCFLLDIIVVAIAILRGYSSFGVLLFSGHVLFLVYAGCGCWQNRFLRYGSLLILIQVAYWKFVLWNDWRSFTLGIVVGLIIHGLNRYLRNKKV
jgi:hypothetical protein